METFKLNLGLLGVEPYKLAQHFSDETGGLWMWLSLKVFGWQMFVHSIESSGSSPGWLLWLLHLPYHLDSFSNYLPGSSLWGLMMSTACNACRRCGSLSSPKLFVSSLSQHYRFSGWSKILREEQKCSSLSCTENGTLLSHKLSGHCLQTAKAAYYCKQCPLTILNNLHTYALQHLSCLVLWFHSGFQNNWK